jgi:hypothetical protein
MVTLEPPPPPPPDRRVISTSTCGCDVSLLRSLAGVVGPRCDTRALRANKWYKSREMVEGTPFALQSAGYKQLSISSQQLTQVPGVEVG